MIWALYLQILLIRHKRLDIALILGMVLGFGVLTKSSAFFAIYLIPFSFILSNFRNEKIREIAKWVGLCLISVLMAYGFYSMLRLSPFFHIIGEKNSNLVCFAACCSCSVWKSSLSKIYIIYDNASSCPFRVFFKLHFRLI